MKMGASAMPTPAASVRIPTPDDPDIRAASRLKTEEEFAKRKGRQSTALAGDSTYSRTTLG